MAISISQLPENNIVFKLMDRCEQAILCTLLLAMIGLACAQIFLRTFFSGGLVWADPLLRYLVLWSGLIGAVTATGKGKHIALDILGGRLPESLAPYVSLASHLFCSVTAAGLSWASWLFLKGEIEFSSPGPLGLPLWFWNTIFPTAFALITLKYILLSAFQTSTFFRSQDSKESRRSNGSKSTS